MDQRSGASKDHNNVDGQGGGNEVKYRGVIRQRSGNYSARIRDPSRRGGYSFLGTYATAEEAARAYDRAAFAKEGRLAILNFPGEHGGATSSAAASGSVMAATSSPSMATQQVIEFECYDDKLLEELLDLTSPKEGSENV